MLNQIWKDEINDYWELCFIWDIKQVHSLCVDSRPGDRLQPAKGPLSLIHSVNVKLTAPPSGMAVRKIQLLGVVSDQI